MDPILQALREQIGVVIMNQPNAGLQKPGLPLLRVSGNGTLAMDAQPELVTVSNGGIPAFLSTFVDPKLIEILVSPMKAAEIAGQEVKKGDWVTTTAMFLVVESTGQVSTYGDYSENGQAGANANFPQRQSYHYQVITQWGERELEMMGLARIDWANRQNIASVLTLNKFQNKSYFYGVQGLQNYGLLNDPSLGASITPAIKAAGGTAWVLNGTPNATALEVIADVQALYYKLQSQAIGLIDLDTRMTLAMSPLSEVAMTFTNQFNNPVADLLKKIFPNMTVKTAPEYSTTAGELVQLFADEVEGQRTVEVAFTEKLRAHPIVVEMSSFRQKKSQGTWGAIYYRPTFETSMLGV